MNKLFQKALVVGVALSIAATTFASDVRLGFVDLKKVFDKYYKTVQLSATQKDEILEIEKERKEMIDAVNLHKDEWHKLLDKANDQAISAAQRDLSKRDAEKKLVELKSADEAIQEFDQVSKTKFLEKKRQRQESIVGEIRAVLHAQAKAHGYTAVLDTSGESLNSVSLVLYYNGDNDLTDDVLKQLNTAAPLTSAAADKTGGLKLNDK